MEVGDLVKITNEWLIYHPWVVEDCNSERGLVVSIEKRRHRELDGQRTVLVFTNGQMRRIQVSSLEIIAKTNQGSHNEKK